MIYIRDYRKIAPYIAPEYRSPYSELNGKLVTVFAGKNKFTGIFLEDTGEWLRLITRVGNKANRRTVKTSIRTSSVDAVLYSFQ